MSECAQHILKRLRFLALSAPHPRLLEYHMMLDVFDQRVLPNTANVEATVLRLINVVLVDVIYVSFDPLRSAQSNIFLNIPLKSCMHS